MPQENDYREEETKDIEKVYLIDEVEDDLTFKQCMGLYLRLLIPGYNVYLLIKILRGAGIDQSLSNLFRAQMVTSLLFFAGVCGCVYIYFHFFHPVQEISEEEEIIVAYGGSANTDFGLSDEVKAPEPEEMPVGEEIFPEETEYEIEETPENIPTQVEIPGVYDKSDDSQIASCAVYGISSQSTEENQPRVVAIYNMSKVLLDPESDYDFSDVTSIMTGSSGDASGTIYAVFGKGDYSGMTLLTIPESMQNSDHMIVFSYTDITNDYDDSAITNVYEEYKAGELALEPLSTKEEMIDAGIPEVEDTLFQR